MKESTYLIILFLFFYSCSMKKNTMRIYSKNNFESLKLMKDSTFEYTLQAGFYYAKSNGKWKRTDGKTIILNSNLQKKELLISEKKSMNSEKSQVKITPFFSIPSRFADMILYRLVTDKGVENASGIEIGKSVYLDYNPASMYIELFQKKEVVNPFFIEEPIVSEKISLGEKGNELSFKVEVPEQLFAYKILTDKVVHIKNGKFSSDILHEILPTEKIP